MKKTLLQRLKKFNFVEPKLEEYISSNYNLNVSKDIVEDKIFFNLSTEEKKWMAYDNEGVTAGELLSHYYFARGDVIVTGLGLGIRENWLLTKKNITSLTIIEKNKPIIDYHKHINSQFLQDKRVKIINCDANDYKGSCDVLLADHYEFCDNRKVLDEITSFYGKINCQLFWFWPVERIVKYTISYKSLRLMFPRLPNISNFKLDYFVKLYHNDL